jgi:hypothetical protein
MQPATSPPPRWYAALAYDPVRRKTVLYGGEDERGWQAPFDDTWEWDGVTWQQARFVLNPPAWYMHQMAYVPALGGMIACGGVRKGIPTWLPTNETWLYDGASWRQLATTSVYPATNYGGAFQSLTQDVGRQTVRGMMSLFAQKTMYWDFRLETLRTQRHPRLAQPFSFDAELPGQAGDVFVLALALSDRPGIPLRQVPGFGTELLPLAPDPLFWLSLQGGLVRVLDAQGKASIPFVLPQDPSLLWLRLYAAGFTFRGGAGITQITNGVPLEIVR